MFCLRNLSVQGSGFRVQNLRSFLYTALFIILFALFSPYPNPYTLTPTFADWVFDADAPTCSITFTDAATPPNTLSSPQLRGTTITIRVTGDDGTGSGVENVSLSGDATIGSTAGSSASTTWTPTTANTYNFTCSVTDKAGNSGSNSASYDIRDLVAPTNPTGSCTSTTSDTTASLTWGASSDATSYSLRVGGTTYSPTNTNYSMTATAASTYDDWGVKACRSTLCSPETAGSSFTCPPAVPATVSASCTAGTSANLSWSSVTSATSYSVRVGTASPVTINAPSTSTTASTTAGDTYGWGVKACLGSVCSDERSGSFVCAPPAPTNPTGSCPPPGSSASLSWGASNGATSYTAIVRSDSRSGITSIPYTFNNLTPGWSYGDPTIPSNTWGVSATNAGGTSSQTAGAAFLCAPPSSTLNAPTLSDCTGNIYTGTLTWGGSPYYTDPDGSGAQTYQWGFWVNISVNDQNFATYYQKFVSCTNPQDRATCTNTIPIPGSPGDRFTYFNNNNTLDTLDNNTSGSPNVYYYRVYNGNTSTPTSLPFSKTCPPLPPQGPLEASCTPPKRGEPPRGTANLLWAAPVAPPSTPADYYNIVVSPESGGTTYSPSSAPTSTSGTVPGLPVNTTYNWTISSCSNSTTPACGDQLTKSTNPTTPSFTCEPAPAWLRTSGGDVHSNR